MSARPASGPSPRLVDLLRAEPFELVLSSGFFGFFAHAGVVSALEEASLRPVLVGGSSAGALVAGLWAAGLSAAQLRERLFTLRRDDFWDPDSWLGLRDAGAPAPGLLRGARFDALLRDALGGVTRFADCAIPLRVVVFDVALRRTRVLDEGDLALALRASCSVPGLLQPTRIGGRLFLDGGIGDRAGLRAATPGARVLHHHLPATSPWRVLTPSQSRPPTARERTHVLVEPSLPRLSPFHLHRGPRACELARAMTLRALAAPAHGHAAATASPAPDAARPTASGWGPGSWWRRRRRSPPAR